MEEGKENSAVRLNRLFEKMVSQPHNTSTAQVLLNAIGGGDVKGREQNALLLDTIQLVFNEMDLLIAESNRFKFSDKSRRSILVAVERLSVLSIGQQWQNNVAIFRASYDALCIFGEGLPDEGPPISPDDLKSLRDSVLSLREEVKNSKLPDSVKTFVYEQLKSIERAIREYPIAGIKAFRTAAKETWFQEMEHRHEAKELEKTEAGSKLKAIKARVIEWSGVAAVIAGLLTSTNTAVESAEKLEHKAVDVVHQVSNVIHHPK